MFRTTTLSISMMALAAILVCGAGTASGELIYEFELYTLPEGVVGAIFGGTLTVEDDAEDDGLLTINDIIAWEVNHSDTTFAGDQSDV